MALAKTAIRTAASQLKEARPRGIPRNAGWRDYESAKARWIESHPQASPEEYVQAMRRIAQAHGL